MEVVFDDIYLNGEIRDLNIGFRDNQITGICGSNNKKLIISMLLAMDFPSRGDIRVGTYSILSNKYLKDVNVLRRNIGYLTGNPDDFFINKTVIDEMVFSLVYFKAKFDEKDIISALQMVGLSASILYEELANLTLFQKKLVMIACSIAHGSELLIFEDFELCLTSFEKRELVNLIRKLKKEYFKTIVIVTNDALFLYELVDYIYCLGGSIIVLEGRKELLLDDGIYNYLPKPKIMEFISTANTNEKRVDNYLELGELLKAVYRNV